MGEAPFYNSIEIYGMYKKTWLDRRIKHSRDTVGDFGHRVVLHIPIGFLIGLTFPLSLPLVMLFIRYEENEDIHTKDQAWKDYFGALVGVAAGLITLIIGGLILWL